MKRFFSFILAIIIFILPGCRENKSKYLPEAKKDKIYTTIGEKKEKAYQTKAGIHRGEGYTVTVPVESYRYEKDYDDGALEEKWEHKKLDDVELKITTYKNSDELTARSRFLRDNEDYIFEDLMGYSLCGQEPDGDILWFNLQVSGETVYIISWEYKKNTSEEIKKELADAAQTFRLAKEEDK